MPNLNSKIQNPKSFRALLTRWFAENGRDLPWRRTRDPYAILVSEIMLQQTQVATVLPYFARWMERFPDLATLARVEESDVLHLWQGLGYYSRARNLHRAAQTLVREHGAQFPQALEVIRGLPGVGRYTAGAVATFAFDQATPIVEANIARVLARVLDLPIPIDTRAGQEILWQTAADLQPRFGARLFNNALMELGALLCTPRRPQCHLCPVAKSCAATEPETLPRKKPRRAVIDLVENCAFIFTEEKILLEQQTQARWRGLWKLPALSTAPDLTPLWQQHYAFTHHRIHLRVFSAESASMNPDQHWHSRENLPPMPSPHRRAVARLLTLEGAPLSRSFHILQDCQSRHAPQNRTRVEAGCD